MRKYGLILLIMPFWLLAAFSPVGFQPEPQLVLSLSRDFGYSSGTGKIQGTFSMKVSGPDTLSRVIFLIDGTQIGEDTEAPYRMQFKTDSYDLGIHVIQAVGYTVDGLELHSNEQRREFVSSEEGWKAAGKIAIPVIVLSVAAVLVSALLPALLGRNKKSTLAPGSARKYGPLGGTICPKCGRPFGLHIFGLNLLIGKLDRCPHCGKWSLVRRVSLPELRAAEISEFEMEADKTDSPLLSEDERLRKELEQTRYQDFQD